MTCGTEAVATDAAGACDDAVEAAADDGDVGDVDGGGAICFADQLFAPWYEKRPTKLIKEGEEGHVEYDAHLHEQSEYAVEGYPDAKKFYYNDSETDVLQYVFECDEPNAQTW